MTIDLKEVLLLRENCHIFSQKDEVNLVNLKNNQEIVYLV
jgi:hypothetical protein